MKDIVFVSSARETKVQVNGRVFYGFAVCLCLTVYFAKVASTKCKQDCLDVFDILEGHIYIYIYIYISL